GGGFMVIRTADKKSYAVDYREMAPAAAGRDIFLDKDGNVIKGEGGSTIGYRASGVPGTRAGFELAFKKHGSGKGRRGELVEQARKLAADGDILSHRLAQLASAYREDLGKQPESKRIFLNDGDYYKEGDLFKQPDLAETLKRIRDNGAKEFYTGRTAELIAADTKANGGLITLGALKKQVAKERTQLTGKYRGYEIITMPPPSSGGIVMLQIMKMLESFDLASLGPNSAAKYHLYAEASRRAFADRAEFMADPDFQNVPVAGLLADDYVA